MNFKEIITLLNRIFDLKEQIEDWVHIIGDRRQRKRIKKAIAKALKAETKEAQEKALKKVRECLWEK